MDGISVIVPTYRDSQAALRTAQALCPSLHAADELLLVDNGSEAAHVEACEAFARLHPGVSIRVLVCEERGSYAARNLGVQHAHGSVFAFTDAGCLPDGGWLAAIREHFAAQLESRVTGPIDMTFARATPSLVELVDARMHLNQDGYAAQGWAATANMAIRREAFAAVGGFHPRLQSGGDYEFGIRAMAHGHAIGWAPAMRVQHEARATVSELLIKRRRVRAGHAQVAAVEGFADQLYRAQLASHQLRVQAEPRAYPSMGPLRWHLGRIAVRLLREYESRFGNAG